MLDFLRTPFSELWTNRHLAILLARRDFESRFRGSFLGAIWAVLPSLLLVGIYGVVFAGIFRSRWAGGSGDPFEYVLFMFAGLTAYGLVAETLSRAPALILQNPNYVKKVVFPLPLLVWSAVGVATVTALINVVVLLLAGLVAHGSLPWTAALLPLAFLPLILLVAAAGMLLAALGVYLRDLQPIVSLSLTALLFLSPVFYPAEALPPAWQWLTWTNPLTIPMEALRSLAIRGTVPSISTWLSALLIGWALLAISRWAFGRAQRGFADVL